MPAIFPSDTFGWMRQPSTPEQESAIGLKFIYRAGATPTSPLALFIHGRAGTREVMWTFERALPEEYAIVAFEAFMPDPIGGFSWWDIESVEPVAVASTKAAQKLVSAIEAFTAYFGLSPEKRIAIGFSQGAALISAALLSGTLKLDAAGLLAGFVVEPETIGLSNRPSIFIAHGTKDEVVGIDRAERGVKRLKELGLAVEFVKDDVGHKIGSQAMRSLKEWIARL